MRTYKKLTIRNFLGFGNKPQVIDLERTGITSIRGMNRDAPGTDSSNGAGKTTIFNAISYVLFDEGIEPIKSDEFVNWTNKKNMMVTIEFEQNGISYSISRGRKPKKMVITKDGVDITPRTDVECNKLIVGILGMDVELFTNSELFTSSGQTYMRMKPSQQKQFMERLLGMNILSDRAQNIKNAAKENTNRKALLEKELTLKQAENERVIRNIDQLKEKLIDVDNSSELETLKSELDKLESIPLKDMVKVYVAIEELVDKKNEIESRVVEHGGLMEEAKRRVEKYTGELEELKDGKCPRCKQEYHDDEEIERISTLIDEQTDLVEQTKDKLRGMAVELNDVNEQLDGIDEPELTLEEIQDINNNIITLKHQIAEKSGGESEIIQDQINLLESEIHDLGEITTAIEKCDVLDEHYKLIIKLLTNSKSFIRMRIIDKYIPYINMKTNEYLEKLGSLHRVEINPDLTNVISYRRKAISFGNLSTGQKLRINFAMCLAFRDYVSNTRGKSNLLMLDEVMDGADRSFVEAAFDVLNDKDNINTMIISHREMVRELVDDEIVVIMRGGFSEIG